MNAPNPGAGKPLAADALANIPRLVTAYFASKPDAADSAQRVSFGTSGHRGSSLRSSFNEDHILATTQAICDPMVASSRCAAIRCRAAGSC